MTSPSARDLVLDAERRFEQASLVYGHGTDNARDEAVFLVFHALGFDFDIDDEDLDRALEVAACERVEQLIDERISSRRPAAYLTGRLWFAGWEFGVDSRALVPRSPIAELINDRFAPWLDAANIRRVLEIGTGGGCIAIATALALPGAQVWATDVSREALQLARENRARYPSAQDRLEFVQADLFPPNERKFDLIITNPPYVPTGVVDGLPPEYQHEPRIALEAGSDGLDLLRRICAGAGTRLRDGGALLVDVGEMAAVVDREIPEALFTWIDLHHGGEGIGLALKSDLPFVEQD